MGGQVIVTIRPNVQFIPDAAAAFMRWEARVRAAYGRNLDVNRTLTDWDTQMSMHLASLAYLAGTGPYPGHSYAAHPKYSNHVSGEAVDSDDWVHPDIIAWGEENGFIRDSLNVANERHHFKYYRSRDQHYGEDITSPVTPIEESEEDDMPKNTGITYKAPEKAPAAQQRHVILIHNTGSGFQFEIDNGVGAGPFDGGFTSKLAKSYDTNDWTEVSEGAAKNIKEGLAAVRAAR